MSEKDWKALYEGVSEAALATKKVLPYKGPDEGFRTVARKGFRKSVEAIAAKMQHQGIACFSAKVDDLLMWSHYADGHRGFCLEFEGSYPLLSKALPVMYSDAVPTLDAAEVAEVWVRSNADPLIKFLFTKSGCWSYEQEWRVLHPEGDGLPLRGGCP